MIDHKLMLDIGAQMILANKENQDRTVFLNRMLAKDVGPLFELWKKNRVQIESGRYDITRGAHTFVGQEGFSYGACAFVSKEARRGGFEIKMPTKNKNKKSDKLALNTLFSVLEDIKAIEPRRAGSSQHELFPS